MLTQMYKGLLKNDEGESFTVLDFIINCIEVDECHITDKKKKEVLNLKVGQTTKIYFSDGSTSEITRIS